MMRLMKILLVFHYVLLHILLLYLSTRVEVRIEVIGFE